MTSSLVAALVIGLVLTGIQLIFLDPAALIFQGPRSSQVTVVPTWTLQGGKFTGSDLTGASRLGVSIAVDGDTLVAGGPYDNTSVGAAWVFTRTAGVWTQQGVNLVGSVVVGSATMGYSVAISDDTVVVGGPEDDGKGAAWVFVRSGSEWTEQTKLVGDGILAGTQYGYAVAVEGDTVAVGGPWDDAQKGAVWVYTRSGTVWTQQAKLVGTGADGAGDARRGNALAISSDTLAVGGYNDGGGGGAVWVFTRTAGVWTQQGAKLVGTGNTGGAAQGWAVALRGNTLVSGGPFDNDYNGATWVFTRTDATWTQVGSKLVAPTTHIGEYASQGSSVAVDVSGTTIAVGAPFHDADAGGVVVYGLSGGVWEIVSVLNATGFVGDKAELGTSVALNDAGTTCVSAGYRDDSSVGAVWSFVFG